MNTSERKLVIISIFIAIGLIFILRLFYIQVIDDKWKIMAANASERVITVYPSRGLIFDREQKILVANTAVYDLMVIPRNTEEMDTAEFCELLGISKEDFISRLKAAAAYSQYKPSIFEKQIPASDYAGIAEHLYQFKGFFGQSRTLRYYPEGIAAHSLGYISEVNAAKIESDPYYKRGDYIGASGIEMIYEKALRGKRGKRYVLVDVHNNEKGAFADGRFDTLAQSGKNLTSSIDLALQKYGELLMQNKRGSIVAIEPSTGEILCIVTSPGYDPNLLVGRVRGQNYSNLLNDTLNPLFNRALMAKYPPGSTFKLIQGLIGLQEGVIDTESLFSCYNGFSYAGRKLGCHSHASPVDIGFAIQTSCNSYFCNTFKRILDKYPNSEVGYQKWREYVTAFGLGHELGVDLSSEVSGFVPESTYYDKFYGRHHWNAYTIISLAIGQGELGITPLQMANMTAILANRGWYITPHVIRQIENQNTIDNKYTLKHYTGIDKEHFEVVTNGMYRVIESGTGRGVKFSKDIEICGKTGTAQNPHGKDHSIFIAFAPKDNPKIALAVYVENVGFGSTWAAPITSLMIEKYLTDTITRPKVEERMLKGNLLTQKKDA